MSVEANGQGTSHLEITVDDLHAGIYLLDMQAGKKAGSVKVVIR